MKTTFFHYPIFSKSIAFFINWIIEVRKVVVVFKIEQKPVQNLNHFFYDVWKFAKSELSVFNSKSKSKPQKLPKRSFLHLKNRNTVYVYSDIFTMGKDIIRQIMEKSSESRRVLILVNLVFPFSLFLQKKNLFPIIYMDIQCWLAKS